MEVDTILNTIMFYGGQTLAARYGIGSTLSNTHIAIPESSGTAAVNILITVPSGKCEPYKQNDREQREREREKDRKTETIFQCLL